MDLTDVKAGRRGCNSKLRKVQKEIVLQRKIIFNESAFRHGVTEKDIRNAFLTFKLDEVLENETEKFIVLGFDKNGNLLEVLYNITDENTINVFHAMKCRKEQMALLER